MQRATHCCCFSIVCPQVSQGWNPERQTFLTQDFICYTFNFWFFFLTPNQHSLNLGFKIRLLVGGSGNNSYFSPCDQTANSNPSHVGASQRAQPAFRMMFSLDPSFRLGEKKKPKQNWIFRRARTTVSHKAGIIMRGSCFCAGTHSRAVRGGTREGYRGEKKWCSLHLYYVSDFYSACPLCWERPLVAASIVTTALLRPLFVFSSE